MAHTLQAIESVPAFEAMVKRRGLEHLWPVFKDLEWKSAAAFSFVLGVNYAQVADDAFITKIVCPLLKTTRADYDQNVKDNNDREPKELLNLRFLFTECQRLIHASLKTLESPDVAPQQISAADRHQRRIAYGAQLETAGYFFEGRSCHAHCIEDDAFLMLQRGHMNYLHPMHCPTRDQETAQEHLTNRTLRPDAPGFKEFGKLAQLMQGQERPEAACSTVMDISDALRRRGRGFQIGGLMDSKSHEVIRQFLLKHLMKEPPRPDLIGPSVEEILAADEAIFVELQKKCDKDPSGLGSVSLHIKDVLNDMEIQGMVMYKQGPSSSGRPTKREAAAAAGPPVHKAKGAAPGGNAAKNKAQRDRKKAREHADRAELERLRGGAPAAIQQPPPMPPIGGWPNQQAGGKAQGKGKGKGNKGKGKA